MTQAVVRYGDQAPMVTVCCNACRTCVSANIVGVATAALAGAGFAVARVAKRIVRPSY